MQRFSSQRGSGLKRSGSHRDKEKSYPKGLGTSTQPEQANLIEQILFREKIDVSHDPAITSSCRRMEYPGLDDKILPAFLEVFDTSQPRHPEPEKVKNDLRRVIAEERKHLDPNEYLPSHEVALFDNWWYKQDTPRVYGEVLKVLYWRGRIQNAVRDVFCALLSRGLITAIGLMQPILLGVFSKEATDLAILLLCFEGVTSDMNFDANSSYGLDFEDPIVRLSIVILRGLEAPIQEVLDTIKKSRFLGRANPTGHGVRKFTADPNVCIGKPKPHKECSWGFWLPYKVQFSDLNVVAEEFNWGRKRFNAIEKCFRDWFGLTQEELLLEEEQAEYFHKFPEREPGLRFGASQYPSPKASES